jgi:DMSO/TMAO reductase YedYZ molybdopterin-dependent catalytic subunit
VARVNGDIGLDDEIEESSWNLQVEVNTEGPVRAGAKNPAPLKISLAQFKTFRQSQTQAEFRCIEGWSQTLAYAGVTFADFLTQTGLGTKSGEPYRKETPRSDLYNYVALETPGGEYYVSVDIESMLHPQTLLASELNGAPLLPENGAPLRLIIPVKYGIKSLKRVGRIYFADERPADYWHERGYDWYSGL